jgi:TolA-binding protein
LLIWLILLAGINFEAYQNNPERYYSSAWQAMNRQDYRAAAIDFDYIDGRRSSPAAQEEALFWAAKAHEQAGDRSAAKQRYQKLVDHYTGRWVPESLYTLARLQRLDNQPETALVLEQRLRSDYPQHAFTRALIQQ